MFCLALLSSLVTLNAQTYQQTLCATIENAPVFCLNDYLSGDICYHITYHVDKKTGNVTNMHWNGHGGDLYDSQGNKYKVMDVGSDNAGLWWDFWNHVKSLNEPYNFFYDTDDEWINGDLVVPDEGTFVGKIKVIGNGDVFFWWELYKFHINGKGEVVLDFYDFRDDCNYPGNL